MVSTVLANRWIPFSGSRAQISKSNFSYSPPPHPRVAIAKLAASNTSGGVSVSVSDSPAASAPWLMMEPHSDGPDELLSHVFRFYCCAKNETYNFFANEYSNRSSPKPETRKMVRSSQGWIAAHGEDKSDLFLVDPTTDRHVKLPPLIDPQVHSLILDYQQEKAFITFGSARNLAFCNLRRKGKDGLDLDDGWTLFGGAEYESVAYSTIHRRLFCITSTSTFKLEAWDVGGETPRLDNHWAAQLEIPARARAPDNLMKQLKYVVCAEHSGDLFVVVRHVSHGGDCGTWVAGEYVRPTVDFEVYKIDQHRLSLQSDSLEGLAIFVGSNDPIAVKGDDVVGVKPNCIYFGYDERVEVVEDMYDFGIFDYQKGAFCARSFDLYYEVSQPFWFTPRRHHNI